MSDDPVEQDWTWVEREFPYREFKQSETRRAAASQDDSLDVERLREAAEAVIRWYDAQSMDDSVIERLRAALAKEPTDSLHEHDHRTCGAKGGPCEYPCDVLAGTWEPDHRVSG